jgi:Dipeptide/tripeptide permease
MQALKEHFISEKVLEKTLQKNKKLATAAMPLFSSEITNKVLEGFQSIRGSPAELYKTFLLKFLDSFSYFTFSLVFTLFLTSDFGYSDLSAGTIYGAWGALVTLFGLLTGVIVDNLGVAVSLRIGFAIQLVAKCIIFYTTSRFMLMLALCLLSLGGCLGIPVLVIGIRRYSNETNRGFNFGLFYVIMNFAALLSGPVVDYCTILYKNEHIANGERLLQQEETYNRGNSESWSLTGYRLIVLLGIFSNIVACLVAQSMKEIKVCDQEQVEMGDCENESSLENTSCKVKTFQPEKASMYEIMKETVYSATFWRFLVVIMVTLNVRMIFRHLDATLPKYMIREFGEDVPKGTIYSINPLMIMILVPLITAATTKVDPLVMIHHGCYISAASVFFLVLSTTIPACVLFVVFLSIGEAIWSPRLYDYTCSIAKEGREGTYMALSSAPLFLAKLPVGMMSGYLLQKFCPEEGERNSRIMWLIIGLTTASSPILLTLCWGYISKKEISCHDGDAGDDFISKVPQHELARLQQVTVPVVNQIELSDIKRRPSSTSSSALT